MSKFCVKCGNSLNVNDKFCTKCGALVSEVQSNKSEVQNLSKKVPDWVIILIICGVILMALFLVLCFGTFESKDESNKFEKNKDVKVVVADFSSMTDAERESWCNDNKINCVVSNEYSDTVPVNGFISQSTNAEKTIYEGDKITIVISLGKEPTVYKSGSYKVGKDLPAGEYYIEGSGYLEVCFASNCDILKGELKYNDNYVNNSIVSVEEGQYLNFSGGDMFPIDEYKFSLKKEFSSSGYYKIGLSLEPGEYRLEGSGYYAICTDPSCDIIGGKLLKNDNISNGGYITVSSGQYLIISGSISGKKV